MLSPNTLHRLPPLLFSLLMGALATTLVTVALSAPVQAAGATWYVSASTGNNANSCSTPNAPCATLQAAVDKASANDTLLIASGVYTNTDAQVAQTTKALTFIGGWDTTFMAQSGTTVVDGEHARRGFNLLADVNLISLTVQNATFNNLGGGLYAGSKLTLTHVSFLDNTGLHGGAMRVDGALVVADSVFENNQCMANFCQGGAVFAAGPVSVANTQFISNTAGLGGGLYVDGLLTLTNVHVLSNTGTSGGGGLVVNGVAAVSDSHFENNQCTQAGCTAGALYTTGALTLTSTAFISNAAQASGGAVYVQAPATLIGGLFQNNTVVQSGGGLLVAGPLTVVDTQFIGNQATGALPNGNGGGIFAVSAITLTNGWLANNGANNMGGGVYAQGPVTLNGGHFEGNSGGQHAGGLYTANTLALTDTEFFSNTATFVGGGARADVAVLNGGQFENNHAGNYGGGLYALNALTVTDAQFVNNSAGNGGGGAIAFQGNASVIGGRFERNRCLNPIPGCLGGGLTVVGRAALTQTLFLSNTTVYFGGGVYVFGPAQIDGARFIGNIADQAGGLGQNAGPTNAHIVNALFANNTATSTLGAGVFITGLATTDIVHTTFAATALQPGSALYIFTSTVYITNTLITSHAVGIENINGSVSEDYNLFFGNTLNISGTVASGPNHPSGNPLFVNPMLSDYHLSPGSAALDVGVDAGVTHDFENHPRPAGAGFEIGFDEVFAGWELFLPLVRR